MINLMPILNLYWTEIIEKNDGKRISQQKPPEKVEVFSDIPYVGDGKWQHCLDVYRPEESDFPLPVIIDIHGGGWMYGKKEINKHYNMVLASKGFTVFSINYHLVPEVTVDVQLQDCMLAFQWIKKNAKQYGGNLKSLFVTGDSAGGFLAAYSVLLNNSERLREVFSTASPQLKVKALALTSPVCYMDTPDIVGLYTRQILGKNYKNSPYRDYVNLDRALKESSLPATYFVTSGGDMPARKATFKAYEDVEDMHVECKLRYKPDKKLLHVFSVTDPYAPESVDVIDEMLAFFRAHE